MMDALVIAGVSILSFWVGLMVGVYLDDRYSDEDDEY